MNLGFGEIMLIVFVALLLFGPKKLPELGKAAGKTLREFKRATKGLMDDEEDTATTKKEQ
ncbi:twin-arginine translocase TatA/TatE family subunit [Metabacillus niabensis]|uniref:Sec-independent protein translocase protein TatA n=1 Tax=Metabacillus niabensis TaxID=324854 RepID=A0ABT9YZM1_9BACI|nr:twin-arginine translocase TatA/TatE family subunit [Metabacillus niabensis]MDQ0225446.1 sec-independent protein translocase protein TatA [Metabacillus niabensis]PAD71015.1 twin-arginine translocase TatA/TatE family subunit [Bacillus sp. 7586-K]